MRTPGRRDTLLAYGQVGSGGLVRELPQGPQILSIVWQVRDRLMHSPLPADRASRPITCCHLLLQFPTRCDEAALDAIAQHFRLLRGLCVLDSTRSIAVSRSSIICKDNASLRKRLDVDCISILFARSAWASHPRLVASCSSVSVLDTQLEVGDLWRRVELLALALQL